MQSSPLSLTLYNIAALSAMPLLFPVLALHPRLRGGLGQRLGAPTPRPRGAVWLHGSSAGDLAALIPLGHRLTAAGALPVYSAWTRAGHQMAAGRLGGDTTVFRAPLDVAPAVGRVLKRLRPPLVVLECLELWPALVSGCARRGIPVAVVNGRLSESSLARYGWARWLFGPCFGSLALVTALTEGDARRFVQAGVPAERVFVEASSKHAATPPGTAVERVGPSLVLGSVHREEEPVLLPWLPRLVRRLPGLRVVVAPRYTHRAVAVRRRLERMGLDVALESMDQPARVLVADTMGRLAAHYRGATVAFVGGSLVPCGGHNLIEAAAAGAAVLTGPYLDHCSREAALLVERGAGTVVCDGASFYHQAEALLGDPERAALVGRRGREVAADLSRAADRIAARLLRLLATTRSRREW